MIYTMYMILLYIICYILYNRCYILCIIYYYILYVITVTFQFFSFTLLSKPNHMGKRNIHKHMGERNIYKHKQQGRIS